MTTQTPPDAPRAGEDPGGEEGDDFSVGRIEVINLVLVALASVASLRGSWPFFWGVLTGGLLMAANFRIIAGVMRAVFVGRGLTGLKVALYWFKFAALLGIVGALILWVKVDGIGFVVGLSTLLLAVVVEVALRVAAKSS